MILALRLGDLFFLFLATNDLFLGIQHSQSALSRQRALFTLPGTGSPHAGTGLRPLGTNPEFP